MRSIGGLAIAMLVACGGDDGSGGGGLTCDMIPACHTDAVAALRACVPAPALTLGTPANNSGVVENLSCTGPTATVTFSTFSFSPTGTVPLPSSATLRTNGTECAVVSTSTGTLMTGDGTPRSFTRSTISIAGGDPVHIDRYDDGRIGIACGNDEPVETSAAALASCSRDVVSPQIFRNDDITMMGVREVDATDAGSPLFTCTR